MREEEKCSVGKMYDFQLRGSRRQRQLVNVETRIGTEFESNFIE